MGAITCRSCDQAWLHFVTSCYVFRKNNVTFTFILFIKHLKFRKYFLYYKWLRGQALTVADG